MGHIYRQKQPFADVFSKKVLLKVLQYSSENNSVAACFNNLLIKKRPQHKCFPVNIAKPLGTPFL